MEQKIFFLADDDSDDTEMFCEAIADIDQNIICHCAINGEKLLEKLDISNQIPQIIFLDVNMPIMNGWECLRVMKKNNRYKDIPVIMMSTSSHLEEIDNAITKGAMCYFVKPNNYNDLAKALKVIIENIETGLTEALANLQRDGHKYIYTL